jgi:hypothetical protein
VDFRAEQLCRLPGVPGRLDVEPLVFAFEIYLDEFPQFRIVVDVEYPDILADYGRFSTQSIYVLCLSRKRSDRSPKVTLERPVTARETGNPARSVPLVRRVTSAGFRPTKNLRSRRPAFRVGQ